MQGVAHRHDLSRGKRRRPPWYRWLPSKLATYSTALATRVSSSRFSGSEVANHSKMRPVERDCRPDRHRCFWRPGSTAPNCRRRSAPGGRTLGSRRRTSTPLVLSIDRLFAFHPLHDRVAQSHQPVQTALRRRHHRLRQFRADHAVERPAFAEVVLPLRVLDVVRQSEQLQREVVAGAATPLSASTTSATVRVIWLTRTG